MLVRAAASQGGGIGAMIAGGLEGNVEIYIQMELCHAHSLADRLRLGLGGGYGPYNNLESTGTLYMLQQLVTAVGYLHARGVVRMHGLACFRSMCPFVQLSVCCVRR
jgi:serine/threonine protein kinase